MMSPHTADAKWVSGSPPGIENPRDVPALTRACPLDRMETEVTFALFSYRVFLHLDGDDHDPIVVGISLTPGGDRVQIMGDISGDESGYVYFDEGCALETTCEPQAIAECVRGIAERLAAQESTIIDAMRNRHPCAVVK